MAKNKVQIDIEAKASGVTPVARKAGQDLRDMGKEGQRAGQDISQGAKEGTGKLDELGDGASGVGESMEEVGGLAKSVFGGGGIVATAVAAAGAAIAAINEQIRESIEAARTAAAEVKEFMKSPEFEALQESRGAFGPGSQKALSKEVLAEAEARGLAGKDVAGIKDTVQRLVGAGKVGAEDRAALEETAMTFAPTHLGASGANKMLKMLANQYGISDPRQIADAMSGEVATAASVGLTDDAMIGMMGRNVGRFKRAGLGVEDLTTQTGRFYEQFGEMGSRFLGQGVSAVEREGLRAGVTTQQLLGDLRRRTSGMSEQERAASMSQMFPEAASSVSFLLGGESADLQRRRRENAPDIDKEDFLRRMSVAGQAAAGDARATGIGMEKPIVDTIVNAVEQATESRLKEWKKEGGAGAAFTPDFVKEREFRADEVNRIRSGLNKQALEMDIPSGHEFWGMDIRGARTGMGPGVLRKSATDTARMQQILIEEREKRTPAAEPSTRPSLDQERRPETAMRPLTDQQLAVIDERLRKPEPKQDDEGSPAQRRKPKQRSRPGLTPAEEELSERLAGVSESGDDQRPATKYYTTNHYDSRTIYEFGKSSDDHQPQDDFFGQGED